MSLRLHIRFAVIAAAAAIIALTFAPTASAVPVAMLPMGSHPLNVSANAYMQWDAKFDGAPAGEFDWSQLWGGPSVFFTDWISPGAAGMYGPNGPGAQTGPTLTGSGTELSPYELTTTYLWGAWHITEHIEYVDGANSVETSWAVQNTSGSLRSYRLATTANAYHVVTTSGEGDIVQEPEHAVVAYNDSVGSALAAVEDSSSPWSAAGEGDMDRILWPAARGPWGTIFDNAVQSGVHDDGIGIEFDGTVAAGETRTDKLTWVFLAYDGLALDAPADALDQGDVVTIPVSSRNRAEPVAGAIIRYAVSGANPGHGRVATSAGGNAQISWTGTNAGVDTVTAWVDDDDDDVIDDSEIARTAMVSFAAPPPAAPPTAPQQEVLGQVVHAPPVPVANPSNLFRFGRTAADKRKGTATITLAVPDAGTIEALVTAKLPVAGHSAKLLRVARVVAHPRSAGSTKIVIRPSKAAKKVLRSRHVLKTTLRVTYTPTGGTSLVKTKSLVLRLARR